MYRSTLSSAGGPASSEAPSSSASCSHALKDEDEDDTPTPQNSVNSAAAAAAEEWLKWSSLANYVNSLVAITSYVYATFRIDEAVDASRRTPLDDLTRLRGQCESEAKVQAALDQLLTPASADGVAELLVERSGDGGVVVGDGSLGSLLPPRNAAWALQCRISIARDGAICCNGA